MTSRRQRNDGVMGREAEPGGAVRTGKEGSTAPHHEHELYRADRGSSCRPSRREVGLGVPRRPAPASFRASTHHRETPPLALPGDDPSSSVVRRTARRPLSRVSLRFPRPKSIFPGILIDRDREGTSWGEEAKQGQADESEEGWFARREVTDWTRGTRNGGFCGESRTGGSVAGSTHTDTSHGSVKEDLQQGGRAAVLEWCWIAGRARRRRPLPPSFGRVMPRGGLPAGGLRPPHQGEGKRN